jgi:hypothetical protein
VTLIGADDLRKRIAAVLTAPEQIQRRWATETVPILRARIPVKTGESRDSVRSGSKPGTIVGSASINFIDAGVREHDITARSGVLKFQKGGQTFFRKKVHKPRQAPHPIKADAARDGLEKLDPANTIIDLWNRSA